MVAVIWLGQVVLLLEVGFHPHVVDREDGPMVLCS